MGKYKMKGLMAVAAAVGLLVAPQARATLTLNNGNAALSGLTPPFGTVEVARVDNNNATVTLTALGSYSFGAVSTLGLNLAGGGTFSISDLDMVGRPGGKTPSLAGLGSGNVSEFGVFNFLFDSKGAFGNSSTSISFNLHTTSGAWTTDDAILIPNAKGFEVVGHVMNANGSITGYATTTPVPEPTTMIAGALLLLPFVASTLRRFRKV